MQIVDVEMLNMTVHRGTGDVIREKEVDKNELRELLLVLSGQSLIVNTS